MNTPSYLRYFKTAMGLTVFFSGHDPITVAKQNALYATLESRLRNGEYDELYELASLAARVKAHSKGKFVLIDRNGQDVVLLHGKPMPTALSKFTLDFVEQGFDTDFIERFWKNLCQNPSAESRESLYAFIEANNMTLTDDGCFIGYRSVRSDWTDHRTGKMDNSVGNVVAMNRDSVDPNPNNTCSRGLHVAAWGYASTFCGGRTIEVKVNPRDVVTVPPDYNQQKMRVCRFTVVSEVEQERDSLVHPDTFVDYDEWDNDTLVDDGGVAVVDDVQVDNEVFVMTVTSQLGVNIPKELAQKAGFAVGDVAHACEDGGVVTIFKHGCCNDGNVCASRTVDPHNSIRLGSTIFKDWGLLAGEEVEGRVATENGNKVIKIW